LANSEQQSAPTLSPDPAPAITINQAMNRPTSEQLAGENLPELSTLVNSYGQQSCVLPKDNVPLLEME
jgi:hypothetical protein